MAERKGKGSTDLVLGCLECMFLARKILLEFFWPLSVAFELADVLTDM